MHVGVGMIVIMVMSVIMSVIMMMVVAMSVGRALAVDFNISGISASACFAHN
jgi:hypothetical protein